MANGNQLALPESVRRQIDTFRQGLWLAETLAAVFGAIAGIFGGYLLIFFSDRLWDTPHWLRVAIAFASLATVAWWVWFWLNRWSLDPQARLPSDERPVWCNAFTRNSAIACWALSNWRIPTRARPMFPPESFAPPPCGKSPDETRHLLTFRKAVSKHQERRWGTAFAVLGVLAVIALIALPLLPLVAERLAAVIESVWRGQTLHALQAARVAGTKDRPVRRTVQSEGRRGYQFRMGAPSHARGRYAEQQPTDVPAHDSQFTFNVPGQTMNGTFAVKAGDARQDVQISPVYRPELAQLQAIIELPEYLGYGTLTQDVRRGTVDLLADSKFTLLGRASRNLTSVADGETPGSCRWNGLHASSNAR